MDRTHEKSNGEKQLKLGNRFKIQVIDDGKVIFESAWKKNLILNQGLDNCASNLIADLFKFCAVGTGGSTPINTQVGLDTEIVRSGHLPHWSTGNCGSTIVGNELGTSGLTTFRRKSRRSHIPKSDGAKVSAPGTI